MVKDSLGAGLPALDFTRPRGAAGEATGYLFAEGGGDAIGSGDAAFAVGLLDRQIANGIIIANHYSGRVYRASTLHLGIWIDGQLIGVLQYGYAMNPASALRRCFTGSVSITGMTSARAGVLIIGEMVGFTGSDGMVCKRRALKVAISVTVPISAP